MNEHQTYNGWSNRETWLASLWLNNDEANQSLLAEASKQPGEVCDKAEWLERQLVEALDELEGSPTLWTDLLRTAFNRVSWVEVVEKN